MIWWCIALALLTSLRFGARDVSSYHDMMIWHWVNLMLEFSGIDEVALYGLWSSYRYVDPRANFKSFSILRPLVRLRGRNGGLSLAIGLRASCAIGTKVVSLRSTLSTFWVVSVISVVWLDRFAHIYARPISVADWFAYIYMRDRLPVLLGDWGYFKLS